MKNKKNYIYKMNTGVMNLIALIILVILFLTINSFIDVLNLSNFELALLIPLMIVWFIIHELIHGVGYYITGVTPKDITYGAKLEKGVLYCLCTGKTSKKVLILNKKNKLISNKKQILLKLLFFCATIHLYRILGGSIWKIEKC